MVAPGDGLPKSCHSYTSSNCCDGHVQSFLLLYSFCIIILNMTQLSKCPSVLIRGLYIVSIKFSLTLSLSLSLSHAHTHTRTRTHTHTHTTHTTHAHTPRHATHTYLKNIRNENSFSDCYKIEKWEKTWQDIQRVTKSRYPLNLQTFIEINTHYNSNVRL